MIGETYIIKQIMAPHSRTDNYRENYQDFRCFSVPSNHIQLDNKKSIFYTKLYSCYEQDNVWISPGWCLPPFLFPPHDRATYAIVKVYCTRILRPIDRSNEHWRAYRTTMNIALDIDQCNILNENYRNTYRVIQSGILSLLEFACIL